MVVACLHFHHVTTIENEHTLLVSDGGCSFATSTTSPPSKMSTCLLVFDGGCLFAFPPRHHHQKRASACSFSMVAARLPPPPPSTIENEHTLLVFDGDLF